MANRSISFIIFALIAITLAFFTAPYLDPFFLKLTARFWAPIHSTIIFKEQIILFSLFLILHLPAVIFFIPKSIHSSGDRKSIAVTLNYITFSIALLGLIHFLLFSFPFRPTFYIALVLLDVCAAIAVITGALAWQRTLSARNVYSWPLYACHWSSIPVLFVGSILMLSAFQYKKNANFKDEVNRLRIWNYHKEDVRWNGDQSIFPEITFNHPIQVAELSFLPGYYLVLERSGRLYLARNAMKFLVLDLSDRIQFNPFGENGALGFAVQETKGITAEAVSIFVFFSTQTPRASNQLLKFRINLFQPQNNPLEEVPLIKQYHRTQHHNGGDIHFGPDGFLYFSIGDESGQGNDFYGNSQRLDVGLYSGIFRIDPDRIGGDRSGPIRKQPVRGHTENYFIPKDNPFLGTPEALGEYWALGLRNPYRFSFDSLTGLMWAGDVGQDNFEEIDIVPKGGNHQWSFREGPEAFLSSRFKGRHPNPLIGLEVQPYYSYRHSAFDRCVIGGFVYRGRKYPDLYGKYIYSDNYSGKVWALKTQDRNREPELLAVLNEKGTFGISSLNTDSSGDILLTILGDSNKGNGRIAKLLPISSGSRMSAQNDRATAIKDKYLMFCARCHGPEGSPAKVDSSPSSVKPRDFTNGAWQSSRSDEQLKSVIKFGGQVLGESAQMPGWETTLSDEEINQMVKHVRSFAKKDH